MMVKGYLASKGLGILIVIAEEDIACGGVMLEKSSLLPGQGGRLFEDVQGHIDLSRVVGRAGCRQPDALLVVGD
jgi:hypothetical protein